MCTPEDDIEYGNGERMILTIPQSHIHVYALTHTPTH